jgi:hypothetical protein
MVPVKSTKEYELQQFVVVLFSETLQRYSNWWLPFSLIYLIFSLASVL